MEQRIPGPAVRITLTYMFVAAVWIVASDRVLEWLAPGAVWLQSYKGLFFVVVTGALLFSMLRTELAAREQAERRRRETEAMFASAFRSGSAYMSIISLEGRFVEINRSYLDFLGYSREEVIGKMVGDLGIMGPEETRKVREILRASGAARDLEVRLHARDGSYRDCLISVDTVLINDQPHWLSMLIDVTGRKRLEDELRYQALLLEQASDAIIATDLDFKVQSINRAAERIYGWKPEEVIGKSFNELARTEYVDTTGEDVLRQFVEAGQWSGEVIQQRKDGGRIHFLAATSYVTDQTGNRIGVVSINRDVTRRKQAELALQESEQRYLSLFENMMDGYAYCHMQFEGDKAQDFIYLEVNKAFERLTGLTNVVGKKVSEVIPGLQQSNPELFEIYGRVALTGKPERFETYVASLKIWFSIAVYSPAQGYFVAVFDNITERKRLEQDLLLTQFCVDHASVGIMRTGSEAQILSANEHYCQMVGYTADELCSMHVYDVDPDFPLERWKKHRTKIRSQKADTFETLHRRKDNTTFPVEVTTTYVAFQGEEFAISFLRDITERKQAQQEIQVLARFPAENPDPVLRVAPDGALLYVNEAGLKLLPELRLKVGRVVPPRLKDIVTKSLDMGSTQLLDVDCDGRIYAFHVAPAIEAGYANLYGRDITEHKKAEIRIRQQAADLAAALQQKDEAYGLLDTIMSAAPVGLAFLDRDLRYQRINNTLAEINGIPAGDHLGHSVREMLPELAPAVEPLFRRVMDTRQPIVNVEVKGEVPKSPGEQRYWLASYYPVAARDESILGLGLVVTDITERKQAEQALRESNDRFHAVIETMPGVVLLVDESGRIRLVNHRVSELFGYTPAELIGQPVEILVPERFHQSHVGLRGGFINEMSPRLMGRGLDLIGRRKDSTEIPVEIGLASVQTRDGQQIVAFVTDITERKRSEQALRESEERFRTLFENMTEGVALHELVYGVEGAPIDYEIVDVNPAYHTHTGITRETAVGKKASDLYGVDQPPYLEIYAGVAATGQPVHFETHFGPMDRSFSISVISTGANRFATIFEDVTEHERSEKALRESEYFLQKSQVVGRIGSYHLDAGAGRWNSSPMLDELFGIGPDFPKTVEGWISLVHPEQQEEMRQYFRQHVLAEHNRFDKEYRIIRHNDRQERWVHGIGELEFDDQGGVTRMIGTIQDITERKQAERQLHASEARFRLLAENAQDGIFRYRLAPEAGFEYLSPAVASITGYAPEDFYTDPELIATIFHPDDLTLRDSIGSSSSGDPFVLRCIRKDGAVIWVELRSTLIRDGAGNVTAIEGIARDITERKRAEESIQKLNRVYAVLSNVNQAIVRIRGLQEIYERACQIAVEDGGFRMAWIGLLDPATRSVLVAADAGVTEGYPEKLNISLDDDLRGYGPTGSAMRTGKPAISNDIAHDRLMAPWRDAALLRGYHSSAAFPLIVRNEVRGAFNLYSDSPGFFDEEENRLLTELAQDISFAMEFAEQDAHRRRAEEAIQKLNTQLEQRVVERTSQVLQIKERVEAILNNSPDAILLLNRGGLIDAGNPAFSLWFGYDRDEVYGRSLADLVSLSSAGELSQTLKVVIENMETHRLETVARRKDGTTFDVTMALAPVQEAGRLFGVVCSLQDISKLKEVERMKDAFVSNVSHELRTPITSIKLNQRLIQMNPDRQQVYLERMEREVNRLNDLIEDLLRLSRLDQGRTELNLAPVNLNDLVEEHVGDRSPIAESRSLSLSAEKKVGLPEVQADRGLLGQALSVLLTNALNYTPPGGSIRVRTATRQKAHEKWIGFVVSDTGPGIPREEMPHLFERFYRGKIGRDSGMPGTGLGLAIAQEIVSRHGGWIEVSSARARGEGVTFSVWLPLKYGSDKQG